MFRQHYHACADSLDLQASFAALVVKSKGLGGFGQYLLHQANEESAVQALRYGVQDFPAPHLVCHLRLLGPDLAKRRLEVGRFGLGKCRLCDDARRCLRLSSRQ